MRGASPARRLLGGSIVLSVPRDRMLIRSGCVTETVILERVYVNLIAVVTRWLFVSVCGAILRSEINRK